MIGNITSCSQLFEFKIIVRDRTNPLFLDMIFPCSCSRWQGGGHTFLRRTTSSSLLDRSTRHFLSFKFSTFVSLRIFLRSDRVDQRLVITYSSRTEPSFSRKMDPNLYHLSRPLIRNVRNEAQPDANTGFAVIYTLSPRLSRGRFIRMFRL